MKKPQIDNYQNEEKNEKDLIHNNRDNLTSNKNNNLIDIKKEDTKDNREEKFNEGDNESLKNDNYIEKDFDKIIVPEKFISEEEKQYMIWVIILFLNHSNPFLKFQLFIKLKIINILEDFKSFNLLVQKWNN